MVRFMRYCMVNAIVAASQSNRENKLSSAPKCLDWEGKNFNWEEILGKTNRRRNYVASIDRTIGGNWSGSPTRINFFAEKSGRRTVLWITCVDSSTKHTSNVVWVNNGWPEPRQVTPMICCKDYISRWMKLHWIKFWNEGNSRSYCTQCSILQVFGNRRWGDSRYIRSIPHSFDSLNRDAWISASDRFSSIASVSCRPPNWCGSWLTLSCPSSHANE